jgi:hypothetical protein
MRVGVAGRGTLDGASQSGKPGIQTDSGKSTLVYMHEYPGHPDDYFTKFRRRRRPSVLASPRAPDMWSNLPNVTRDACGVFVQTFPKELIVRRSAYLSVFHHHLRRVARARSLYFFFPSLAGLPFFLLVHARHNTVHAGSRAAIHTFIVIDQCAILECCDARRRTLHAFSPGARRGRQCNGRDGTLRRRVRARG